MMNNSIKKPLILHIVNSNIYSGLEKVAIKIIEEYKDKYDFMYVCKDGKIIEYLNEKNIKRIKISSLSRKEILRIQKEYKPDIIHAHDYRATLICGMFLKETAVISHLHNNSPWLKKWLHPYNYIFLKSILNKNVKKILTVSSSIEREFIFSKFVKSKIELIGNPIDVDAIIKDIDFNADKEYDICFSGRLTEQKNPLEFINIIAKVKENNPNIKAIMLGDGELKEKCLLRIKKLGLEKNIELKGFVKEPFKEMIKAKIFCLTSKWEGYGLVAVEALLLGLPCVVSAVGGLKDIVDKEYGFLCKNTEDFVNNIENLLRDNNYKLLSNQIGKNIYNKGNLTEYMKNIDINYSKIIKNEI